jgi:hypothetical protein
LRCHHHADRMLLLALPPRSPLVPPDIYHG